MVRQRPAKPLSPVRVWASPPTLPLFIYKLIKLLANATFRHTVVERACGAAAGGAELLSPLSTLYGALRRLRTTTVDQQSTHAYKRAGTGTWRHECGWRCGCGLRSGCEVQKREHGSANADGGAGADDSTNASCRNRNVGGGFKQKQQNRNRSNKKTPAPNDASVTILTMVSEAGFEPARCCHRWILSPVRLPIPSLRLTL